MQTRPDGCLCITSEGLRAFLKETACSQGEKCDRQLFHFSPSRKCVKYCLFLKFTLLSWSLNQHIKLFRISLATRELLEGILWSHIVGAATNKSSYEQKFTFFFFFFFTINHITVLLISQSKTNYDENYFDFLYNNLNLKLSGAYESFHMFGIISISESPRALWGRKWKGKVIWVNPDQDWIIPNLKWWLWLQPSVLSEMRDVFWKTSASVCQCDVLPHPPKNISF